MSEVESLTKCGRHPVTIRRKTPQEILEGFTVADLVKDWDDRVTIEKRSKVQKRNNAYKESKRLYGTRGRA